MKFGSEIDNSLNNCKITFSVEKNYYSCWKKKVQRKLRETPWEAASTDSLEGSRKYNI